MAQKKVRITDAGRRMSWIDDKDEVPLRRQCLLAGVARATWYGQRQRQAQTGKPGLTLTERQALEQTQLKLIDHQYTRTPFYGTRKMVRHLSECGHRVNRKRVQRLMRKLGLQGIAPGPATSKAHPQHRIYPYLLRGVEVSKVNQVWSTDITYIRIEGGCVYLVAVIDWYSRKVLSWRLSNTMDTAFCIDALEQALTEYGKPAIFNTDQGSQFTSHAFTGKLLENHIEISMDGRGRAADNIFVERLWRSVKYENVYLNGYRSIDEAFTGLTKYFAFYNGARYHQALGYQTPQAVYRSGHGGGALIVDKFGSAIVQEGAGPPSGSLRSPACDPAPSCTIAKAPGSRAAAGEKRSNQSKPKQTTNTGQRRSAACEAGV
jgi:putative transposase